MRHQKSGRKLGRNTNQRQALIKGLLRSLILNESIQTTEAKAKTIKGLLDKLMTKAKNGSLSARRQVLSFLPDKKAVHKLFDDVAKRTKERTSGFTTMVKVGRRRGDNAMIARIELVDKPLPKEKASAKGGSASGGKKEPKPKKSAKKVTSAKGRSASGGKK